SKNNRPEATDDGDKLRNCSIEEKGYELTMVKIVRRCTSCERSLNYATKMARMLQSSTFSICPVRRSPFV
ncbi:hypothetical protein L9F63_020087, partial [Diploptera punctata]